MQHLPTFLKLSGSLNFIHSQEDEAMLDRQAANESVGQFTLSLTYAGLRQDLAAALSLTSTSEPDSEAVEEPRKPPLLAWAVVLSLILEQPARSEGRSRLSQALHENHRFELPQQKQFEYQRKMTLTPRQHLHEVCQQRQFKYQPKMTLPPRQHLHEVCRRSSLPLTGMKGKN